MMKSGIVILAALACSVSDAAHAQSANGIWVNAHELATLPMSGPAWTALKTRADAAAPIPNLADQSQHDNIYVLAKALVYARTGDVHYRAAVIDLCMRAINTELGGRTLALGRKLAAYVIAAELVVLPPDQNAIFRIWLRRTLSEPLDGETLQSTHERRPNNWGTHAGASRAAVAAYLGDMGELNRTAQVFKGWLGDRAAYSKFSYGELSWQCDAFQPVGVNPPGCMKGGHLIDGVLPDDQRRSGTFVWPPFQENYVWEALQGAVAQAEILNRFGFDTYNWSSRALLRAVAWLHVEDGFPATGDDSWEPHIVNFQYATTFFAPVPSQPGKNVGFSDWTHGPGRVRAAPAPVPDLMPPPVPLPH